MAALFPNGIDLNKTELKNAALQNLAADPGSPVTGQMYFNTISGKKRTYNGATWDEEGSGGGDVVGPSSAVDSEVVLFNSTTGKLVKRATISGIPKLTSGVLSAATPGTDYSTPSSTDSLTNKTFNANGTGNSITNLETADFAANVIDTDVALAANSDTRLASQKAVKAYVDAIGQGLRWKAPVRAATTANGTLATAFENGDTIDGVTLVTGDRILLKDQSSASENGIYTVNASGAPTRATDADAGAEVLGMVVDVLEGTVNADTAYVCTNNGTITLGSTSLVFVDFIKANVPAATTSVAGKVQLADATAAEAKSSSTTAVTPAALANFTIKKTFTIGDGVSTSIACTHSLGTRAVITQVYDASTFAVVYPDIVNTSTSVTTITFAVAPGSNSYIVVIQG